MSDRDDACGGIEDVHLCNAAARTPPATGRAACTPIGLGCPPKVRRSEGASPGPSPSIGSGPLRGPARNRSNPSFTEATPYPSARAHGVPAALAASMTGSDSACATNACRTMTRPYVPLRIRPTIDSTLRGPSIGGHSSEASARARSSRCRLGSRGSPPTTIALTPRRSGEGASGSRSETRRCGPRRLGRPSFGELTWRARPPPRRRALAECVPVVAPVLRPRAAKWGVLELQAVDMTGHVLLRPGGIAGDDDLRAIDRLSRRGGGLSEGSCAGDEH